MSVSFKDNRVAFEYQCKHGIVELKPLLGVVALVLDARAEFGEAPVEVGENGQQLVMVASRDGGFVVPARTTLRRRIFLRADQSTAYGNVVEVMTQLEEEGFARIGIYGATAEEG